MFIMLDRPTQEEFIRIYDHINEINGKVIGSEDDIEQYTPTGPEHIVAEVVLTDESERWKHLWLASLGGRLYSNRIGENHWAFNSPLYAGPIPLPEKTRKVAVDGAFAEGRAGYFRQFGVNYIGRSNLNPRNIFVLDNKKGNPLHDPSKDDTLKALYASLPDDWWGSCAFVSTSNVDKLGGFLDSFQGDVIPIAFTTGAYGKLRYLGLDYVDSGVPSLTEDYGVRVRDAANRLSYKLSLTPEERAALEIQ